MKSCILFLALSCLPAAYAQAIIQNPHGSPLRVEVQSWKEMRDAHVIKQEFDFSCGAASIATLLGGAYGVALTEAKVLEAMDKQNGRASFEDMARVVERFGFRAQGYSSTFAQLLKLKVPVILYVKHRKYDHFTVLRGVGNDMVWLADPSVGNHTLSRTQFLDMWETISPEAGEGVARGKFLAILPQDTKAPSRLRFFDVDPKRLSRPAMLQLIHAYRR